MFIKPYLFSSVARLNEKEGTDGAFDNLKVSQWPVADQGSGSGR